MPEREQRPTVPAPGEPVPSFDAPSHIEKTWVERIDVTSSTYTKLPRGTLYKDVVGADSSSPFAKDILENHPTAFLLREIVSPRTHPFAFRYWGLGEPFTTTTIGQPNLTPAKYRRLVRTIETDQPVDASYTFPTGLTGDQTQIQLQQETIEEARLKIISELIAIGGDPLLGAETDPFGPLAIYESVVPEGTPVDDGYLVVKSTVTPFGNGKAVKITVKYPIDLAMRTILNRSIGQDNLVPAKYRRLVQHKETDSLVNLETYVFPNFLTGNQTEVQEVQETIFRARQKIVEELIAIGANPLIGNELDPFGSLTTAETIVNEGTPIDTGYLVLKSDVSPFGNGKSVKITVTYPLNLALLTLLKQSIGQDNLIPAKYRRLVKHNESESMVDLSTYVFPNSLVGDQTEVRSIQETISRARQTIISEVISIGSEPLIGQETFEFGIESITETIVPDGTPADEGFFIAKSTVTPFGNGKSLKINVVYPANISSIPLESDLWDENMRLLYDETEFIVAADTPPDPDPGGVFGWLSEVKATDKWHSRKINTSKPTPLYVDAASALISYQFRAFKFPGRLGIFQVGAAVIGDYQAPAAQIVQHKIRTWWEKNAVTPTPAFDEIIAGTVLLGPTGNVTYSDVLHDILFNSLGMIYGPTTPSYSTYTGRTGAIQITGSIHMTNGSAAVVGTGTLFTTELVVGDTLGVSDTAFVILSITDDTHLTLTNAWTSLTTDITQPIFTTFSGGWIGTEKVISASVTPEREKDIWKIQTSSVVMR